MAGQKLRMQIVTTASFVFVTFLLRSVFSTMTATAYALQSLISDDVQCALQSLCNAQCHNTYSHMLGWIYYTPEFELAIVLISSPLSLLVALWGMTSEATLQAMQHSTRITNVSQQQSLLRNLR